MNRFYYLLALLLAGVSLSCSQERALPPPESPLVADDPVVQSAPERPAEPDALPAESFPRSLPTGTVRRAAEIGIGQLQKRDEGDSAEGGTRLKMSSETLEMLGDETSDRRLHWEAGLEVNGNGDAVEIRDVGIAGDRLSVSHSLTTEQINVKWKTNF